MAFACVLAAPAGADTVIEGFDGGSNVGGWTYAAPHEEIETEGGNPGARLHAWNLDSFAPRLRTAWGVESVFTGDFRTRQVSSLGVDLILHDVDISAESRPLSIVLVHDNFTRDDSSDDYGAYFVGNEEIPLVGEGWKSFDFAIPSQLLELPEGWRFIQLGPAAPLNPQWVDIVSQVSQTVFFYGDPSNAFYYQLWDVAADNLRISEGTETEAAIVGFTVPFGTHVSGGVAEIEQSDDAYLQVRSRFGFPAGAQHVMEIRIDFVTSDLQAPTLDLEIESRLDQSGGTARIRLRDWDGGSFVQVDQHAIGVVEMIRTVNDIDAAGFVQQSDGRIQLSVRHSAVAAFSAAGFTSFFDRTSISTGG